MQRMAKYLSITFFLGRVFRAAFAFFFLVFKGPNFVNRDKREMDWRGCDDDGEDDD